MQCGKSLTWYVTVVHTLADSYVRVTARSGGAAVEQAASWKTAKYDLLVQTGRTCLYQKVVFGCGRLFQPIAAETLGPLNESSITFLSEMGHKIASVSEDNQAFFSSTYRSLFSTLIPYTTVYMRWGVTTSAFRFPFNFVFNPRDLYARGYLKKVKI